MLDKIKKQGGNSLLSPMDSFPEWASSYFKQMGIDILCSKNNQQSAAFIVAFFYLVAWNY